MLISPHTVQTAVVLAAQEISVPVSVGVYAPLAAVMLLAAAAYIIFLEWHWGKICSENYQLLIVRSGGQGDYELAPLKGGSVAITNKDTGTTKLWPINSLSTVDVPYPGVGFVPTALQKTIRQVIVSEDDWEPLLNRSPYKEKVASPDIVVYLQNLSERVQKMNPDLSVELMELADQISPSPTREMIASPAVIGNLINEKITEAVITVNKETIDKLAMITNRIAGVLQSNIFFIGIGVVGLLCLINLIMVVMLKSDLGAIKEAIGIATK